MMVEMGIGVGSWSIVLEFRAVSKDLVEELSAAVQYKNLVMKSNTIDTKTIIEQFQSSLQECINRVQYSISIEKGKHQCTILEIQYLVQCQCTVLGYTIGVLVHRISVSSTVHYYSLIFQYIIRAQQQCIVYEYSISVQYE